MKLNRIISIIALIVCIVAFICTNSIAMLGFALLILAAAVISILFGKWNAAHTSIDFAMKSTATVDEKLTLEIRVTRPRLFRGRIDFSLENENALTGVKKIIPVSLTPEIIKEEHYYLPLDTTYCGCLKIHIENASSNDIFGFAAVTLKSAVFAATYTVYPPLFDVDVQLTHANRIALSGITYDPHRRGKDTTEVFEMRDYQPGDPLKAIHWKVSARLDELVVREASRPTDSDVMLLVDARVEGMSDARHAQTFNGTYSVATTLSLALARCGIGHVVAWRDSASQLQSHFVDGAKSHQAALDEMISTPLPQAPFSDAQAIESYRQTHNVSKIILLTNDYNEQLFTNIGHLYELNAVQIGSEGALSLEEKETFDFTFIPASTLLTGSVKSLEL